MKDVLVNPYLRPPSLTSTGGEIRWQLRECLRELKLAHERGGRDLNVPARDERSTVFAWGLVLSMWAVVLMFFPWIMRIMPMRSNMAFLGIVGGILIGGQMAMFFAAEVVALWKYPKKWQSYADVRADIREQVRVLITENPEFISALRATGETENLQLAHQIEELLVE